MAMSNRMSVPRMRRLAPFDPTQISNCCLWLDANDASTVTGTTTVTAWRDKSTNAYNLVPGTGTTSYANNAITINSSYLYATGAVDLTTFTFFIVAKNIGTSYNQPFFGALPNIAASTFDSTDGFGWYMDNGNSTRFFGRYINNTGQWITTSINTLNIGLYAVTGTSGGVYTQWNNGTLGNTVTSSSRTSTGRGFTVGGEWYGPGSTYYTYTNSGSIYEVVVYNTVLSTAQQQQIEGYLAQKWGLKNTLPGGHPGLTSIIYPTPRTLTLTPRSYVTSFTPTGVAGSTLWLDGADPAGNGTTPSNGASLSSWTDKSGNGLTVSAASSQPTYTTNAANGLGTVAFSGTQGLTAGSVTGANLIGNTGGCAIFCVFAMNSTTAYNFPLTWDDSSYTYRFVLAVGNSHVAVDNGNLATATTRLIVGSGLTYVANQYSIISYWQNGSNAIVNLNGTTVGSVTNFTVTSIASYSRTFNVGTYVNDSQYNMKGNTAEIILYNTNIPSNFQQVEGYLAWKWGIQSSLPASHPYKSASPIQTNPLNLTRPAQLLNQYPTPKTTGTSRIVN
jgi:hypothetical protein